MYSVIYFHFKPATNDSTTCKTNIHLKKRLIRNLNNYHEFCFFFQSKMCLCINDWSYNNPLANVLGHSMPDYMSTFSSLENNKTINQSILPCKIQNIDAHTHTLKQTGTQIMYESVYSSRKSKQKRK